MNDDLHWTPTEFGWTAPIPEIQFCDVPLRIDVNTRPYPEGNAVPAMSRAHHELVELILDNLPDVIDLAEREFRKHCDGTALDSRTEGIKDPRIWIECPEPDDIAEDGSYKIEPFEGESWAIVIGQKAAPDFAIHIEFDGTELTDVWGGD